MKKKFLGIGVGIAVIVAVIGVTVLSPGSEPPIISQSNDKIGLVINSPSQSTTLQELDQIYSKSTTTDIGRSNVYLFLEYGRACTW